MGRPPEGSYRINPVALIEATLEYYRLADQVLIPETKASYQHAIATRKFAGENPVRLPSHVNPVQAWESYPAGQDIQYHFPATTQAEQDAYQALWRLYSAFRQSPERVPFVRNDELSIEDFLSFLDTSRL
jgi:hypothetical protein